MTTLVSILSKSVSEFHVNLCRIFLTFLFKLGLFPDKLKIAFVIPIFRAGENWTLGSYRPTSVLPCFSKILERIIYNGLYKISYR